jgi:hypothetical protein
MKNLLVLGAGFQIARWVIKLLSDSHSHGVSVVGFGPVG